MKDDKWTFRDRDEWIDQLTDDPKVRTQVQVGWKLCRFISRKTGYAFPSQTKFSAAAGMTIRNLQGHLAKLALHGHLKIESGQGRHKVCRYTPIFKSRPGAENTKDPAGFTGEKTRRILPENTKDPSYSPPENTKDPSGKHEGSFAPISCFNSLKKENSVFNSESAGADERQNGFGKRAKEEHTHVNDYEPSEAIIAGIIRAWDECGRRDLATRIDPIIEQFKRHRLDTKPTSGDWDAALLNYCARTPDLIDASTSNFDDANFDHWVRRVEKHCLERQEDGTRLWSTRWGLPPTEHRNPRCRIPPEVIADVIARHPNLVGPKPSQPQRQPEEAHA